MTDRELMQQALDALDKYGFMPMEDETGWQHFRKTIEALRARLAEPEPYAAQAAMVAGQTQGRMRIDPVTGDVGIGNPNQVTLDTSGATGFKLDASAPLVVHPHPAFQAPPPQRKWIGLTDEEKVVAYGMFEMMGAIGYTQAIEAKLKEKNT